MRLLEKHGETGDALSPGVEPRIPVAPIGTFTNWFWRVHPPGSWRGLLLSWSSGRERESVGQRIAYPVQHSRMKRLPQMIGSSRETVTRLLSELKKKELIRLEGSTLVIRNRTALEALAA